MIRHSHDAGAVDRAQRMDESLGGLLNERQRRGHAPAGIDEKEDVDWQIAGPKNWSFCRTPSSNTSNRSGVRSVTGRAFAATTVTFRFTSSVALRNVGLWAGASISHARIKVLTAI